MEAATLDEASGGPLRLGLGAALWTLRALGEDAPGHLPQPEPSRFPADLRRWQRFSAPTRERGGCTMTYT
jgi:hypothetical protein